VAVCTCLVCGANHWTFNKSFSPKLIDHAVGDRSEDSFIKCNLWKVHRSHIGWSNTSVAHQKLTEIQNSHVQTQIPHIEIQTDVFNIKAREQLELTPVKRDVACNRTHGHGIPNHRSDRGHHVCEKAY
jgi:hypothetical protein